MGPVFELSFSVINPVTTHCAADTVFYVSNKDPAQHFLLYSTPYRNATSHDLMERSHGIIESCLKLLIFSSALVIKASVE